MAKKKQKKSSIVPMLAVGLGIYLLMRNTGPAIAPIKPQPSLPTKAPSLPQAQAQAQRAIGTRKDRSRYIPTTL